MRSLELNGWQAASLVAFLPMLACSTSEGDDGFRITSLAVDGQDRLVLTFSEPIVDPSNVDPADFALSIGRTSRLLVPGMEVMQQTYYSGLGSFDSIGPGSSPTQLVLTPSYTIDFSDYCDQLTYYLDYYQEYIETYLQEYYPGATGTIDLAMFLHYAAGDIPIESEQGETIADVAPDFVLSGSDYFEEERFGFLNYLRIPCP